MIQSTWRHIPADCLFNTAAVRATNIAMFAPALCERDTFLLTSNEEQCYDSQEYGNTLCDVLWCLIVGHVERTAVSFFRLKDTERTAFWMDIPVFTSLETWRWGNENMELKCLITLKWRFWENWAELFGNISCIFGNMELKCLRTLRWSVWENWAEMFENIEMNCLRKLSWNVWEHWDEAFDNMELKVLGKNELKCLITRSRNIREVGCREKVPQTEKN